MRPTHLRAHPLVFVGAICLAVGVLPTSRAEPRQSAEKVEIRAGARDVTPAVLAILARIRADEPVSIEEMSAKLADLGPTAVVPLLSVLDSGLPDSLAPEHEEVVIAALSRFPRAVLLKPVAVVLQTSERARTRAACLRVVGAVGDQRDLDLLCSTVRPRDKGAELDPALSQEFEQAVTGILLRNETAFVWIKRCLRTEPSATRQSLFRSLADTVSEPGLEELGQNLGVHPDEDPLLLGEMKRASALIRLPVPDSIPNYLRPRLVEDDPYRLALAVACVGSLEDADSLDALLPLLRHSDPEVARAAHAALCSITGIHLIPDPQRWNTWLQSETAWFTDQLPRLAPELHGEGPACASAIAEMAAHPLHRRELAELLGRDLSHQPPAVREMACAALRQLGGAYALQSLDRCAQDPDAEAASAAQRALAGLPRRPGRAEGSDSLR